MIQLFRPQRQVPVSSELAAALGACRRAFLAIGLFSGMSNILMVTGSLFLLEVYDRVLPSRSVPTLVALLILTAGLFAAQGFIDAIRSRILVRIGHSLDATMSMRVYDAIVRLPLMIGGKGDGSQPVRDLDAVRGFLSVGFLRFAVAADLPGHLLLVSSVHRTDGPGWCSHPHRPDRGDGAADPVADPTRDPIRRSAQHPDGIEPAQRRSDDRHGNGRPHCQALGRPQSLLHRRDRPGERRGRRPRRRLEGSAAMLQSSLLAVGAWLVIHQESTPGIIIAGSILGGRALAPVDLAIANWRGFIGARQSWQRLSRLLGQLAPRSDPMPLQPPSKSVVVQNAAVTPPGEQKIVYQDVNFTLTGGKALGIIGPTASGKSSLARMLVGVWAPLRGTIRLDGATLDQWSPEALGRHIGYLPQDVELFPGNVAQNIGRFEDPPNPEAVLAAAQAAGVHDLIVNLPDGYETKVGERGGALSAGQAQRIALARAVPRSVFGRARRTELKPRRGRRRSADKGHSRRARPGWGRSRGRAPPERHRRCRLYPGDGQGPSAAIRPQRRDSHAGRATADCGAHPEGRSRRGRFGMSDEAGAARASIRRHVVVGCAIVLFLAVGLGGWAATAEIAGALIAQGSLVVDSNVKKVQHLSGGVVARCGRTTATM